MTARSLSVLSLAAVLLAAASCGGSRSAKMGPAPAQYKVRLQTTKGEVVLLIHRDWSPLGADHFYELTKWVFTKTMPSSAS